MLPATYNIDYYIGDTKDIILYPKNRDGSKYNLTDFVPAMVISNKRSATPDWSVDGIISVDADEGFVFCSIEPDIGNQLTEGLVYYYDVELRKTVADKEYVYTILRGEIRPIMGVNRSV